MTRDERREVLKGKIEAARSRFGDRSPEDIAAEAASAAVDYAKQNPWVVIGGAVALGLAIGAMTRQGRKAAAKSGLLGRLATDAAIGFAIAMYEKAQHKTEAGIAKTQELIGQDKTAE